MNNSILKIYIKNALEYKLRAVKRKMTKTQVTALVNQGLTLVEKYTPYEIASILLNNEVKN